MFDIPLSKIVGCRTARSSREGPSSRAEQIERGAVCHQRYRVQHKGQREICGPSDHCRQLEGVSRVDTEAMPA